ncbi:ATP-binding cassette domain-containing protein [Streptomyces sp. KR80]|uniref:ATP-binding cassette domain-containing protein n=1 Tax=Streptomyces sp. KR80 TaxID=3457426 RepID=UPI003FD4BB55
MNSPKAALEASGLGMAYSRRKKDVLADCSFRFPQGRVCALVGPNGAGKSTLLGLAAGLLRPTAGTLTVLGQAPAEARDRIAYVDQTRPLHPHLSVADTLCFGAELNRPSGRWDQQAAERIAYGDGGLEPTAKVRSLSSGQRTRVALALAFGKRPELMLLDEPMADLDPLARRQLTGALMSEAAEHGTSIVMSSHVIAELEGICDYLLLLCGGRVRLGGETEEVVAAHTLITGTATTATSGHTVIEERPAGRGRTALVRPHGAPSGDLLAERPSLEDVLLAHLRNPHAPALLTESAIPVLPQHPQE